MKRVMIGLLVAFAFAAMAQAQTAPAQPPATAAVQEDNQADTSKTVVDERHCLRQTGSRILTRTDAKDRCTAANGRSYSRDELNNTGAVDIADALRKLDPSIR